MGDLKVTYIKADALKEDPQALIDDTVKTVEGAIRLLKRIEGDHEVLIDMLADRGQALLHYRSFEKETLMCEGSWVEYRFVMTLQVLDTFLQQAFMTITKSRMKSEKMIPT